MKVDLNLGDSVRMGPKLRSKVEAQLLEDLRHYGIQIDKPSFDWSDSCIEGHQTNHLDGTLENFSNVSVKNADGEYIAAGWIEFIHGGDPNALFVFWDELEVWHGQRRNRLRNFGGIPQHIWDKLPISSRNLLADTSCDEYDARWCRDPLVIAWRKSTDR